MSPAFEQSLAARVANLDAGLARRGLDVRTLLALCDKQAPGGSVLMSGSIVEGVDNPFSDIDLFVVTADVERDLVITGLGDLRIDIETWPMLQIAQVGARISAGLDLTRQVPYFQLRELKFVARLFNAVQLACPHEPFDAERLGVSRESYLILLCRRFVSLADSTYQDGVGAFLAADYPYGFLRARDAFTLATDALLSRHGHLEPDKKHRLRLLGQMPELAAVRADFIAAQSSWHHDEPGWRACVDGLLRKARSVIVEVSRWVDAAAQTRSA